LRFPLLFPGRFVERGGLTGVDVINRNPNGRIGFNDMMERLERIRRKGHERE